MFAYSSENILFLLIKWNNQFQGLVLGLRASLFQRSFSGLLIIFNTFLNSKCELRDLVKRFEHLYVSLQVS